MGTFQPDETTLITNMYGRPVRCSARYYGEKILYGTATVEDLLDVQMLVARNAGCHCTEIWAVSRLYEDHIARLAEIDRQQRDPTIQERDRRSSPATKGE